MEDLKNLIQKGVKYEDEFIETYMKVVRDEGYIEYFGEKSEEAKKLLNILISESQEHKEALASILEKI